MYTLKSEGPTKHSLVALILRHSRQKYGSRGAGPATDFTDRRHKALQHYTVSCLFS